MPVLPLMVEPAVNREQAWTARTLVRCRGVRSDELEYNRHLFTAEHSDLPHIPFVGMWASSQGALSACIRTAAWVFAYELIIPRDGSSKGGGSQHYLVQSLVDPIQKHEIHINSRKNASNGKHEWVITKIIRNGCSEIPQLPWRYPQSYLVRVQSAVRSQPAGVQSQTSTDVVSSSRSGGKVPDANTALLDAPRENELRRVHFHMDLPRSHSSHMDSAPRRLSKHSSRGPPEDDKEELFSPCRSIQIDLTGEDEDEDAEPTSPVHSHQMHKQSQQTLQPLQPLQQKQLPLNTLHCPPPPTARPMELATGYTLVNQLPLHQAWQSPISPFIPSATPWNMGIPSGCTVPVPTTPGWPYPYCPYPNLTPQYRDSAGMLHLAHPHSPSYGGPYPFGLGGWPYTLPMAPSHYPSVAAASHGHGHTDAPGSPSVSATVAAPCTGGPAMSMWPVIPPVQPSFHQAGSPILPPAAIEAGNANVVQHCDAELERAVSTVQVRLRKDEDQVQILLQMGFGESAARKALDQSDGNIDAAIETIVSAAQTSRKRRLELDTETAVRDDRGNKYGSSLANLSSSSSSSSSSFSASNTVVASASVSSSTAASWPTTTSADTTAPGSVTRSLTTTSADTTATATRSETLTVGGGEGSTVSFSLLERMPQLDVYQTLMGEKISNLPRIIAMIGAQSPDLLPIVYSNEQEFLSLLLQRNETTSSSSSSSSSQARRPRNSVLSVLTSLSTRPGIAQLEDMREQAGVIPDGLATVSITYFLNMPANEVNRFRDLNTEACYQAIDYSPTSEFRDLPSKDRRQKEAIGRGSIPKPAPCVDRAYCDPRKVLIPVRLEGLPEYLLSYDHQELNPADPYYSEWASIIRRRLAAGEIEIWTRLYFNQIEYLVSSLSRLFDLKSYSMVMPQLVNDSINKEVYAMYWVRRPPVAGEAVTHVRLTAHQIGAFTFILNSDPVTFCVVDHLGRRTLDNSVLALAHATRSHNEHNKTLFRMDPRLGMVLTGITHREKNTSRPIHLAVGFGRNPNIPDKVNFPDAKDYTMDFTPQQYEYAHRERLRIHFAWYRAYPYQATHKVILHEDTEFVSRAHCSSLIDPYVKPVLPITGISPLGIFQDLSGMQFC
jgi:hypothetical protein